jgi:2-methylisocitrate lyase-like PEP mutase family enzyme
MNIEDSPGSNGQALLSPDAHAQRIRVARDFARSAGGDLVINARTDLYLFQVGDPERRLEAVTERARLYRSAGADLLATGRHGQLDPALRERHDSPDLKASKLLVRFNEHTSEHYGQVAVYARLMGIVPPASRP